MAGVSHIVANELYDKGVRRTKKNASSTATFVMTKRGVGDRRDKNDKLICDVAYGGVASSSVGSTTPRTFSALSSSPVLLSPASDFENGSESKAGRNPYRYWWAINARLHSLGGPSERRERDRIARKHRTVVRVGGKNARPLRP
jgi:hypothetical protein